MRRLSQFIVLIKGAGEVASGIAHTLQRRHFLVCLTEVANPLAICRGTTFSEAVYDGIKSIEGVTAELVSPLLEEVYGVWRRGNIPIVIDPEASVKDKSKPDVLVDAIMAKRNTGTKMTDAPLVIGIGPGFYAGRDVHIVVETNHSENLGRVILEGEAEKDTGIPIALGGLTTERVIRAPQAGTFTTDRDIGDSVSIHQIVGWVGDKALKVPVNGILRGLMRNGVRVTAGTKLVEIDPIHDRSLCFVISDKAKVISLGVLDAIMLKFNMGE